VADVQVPVFLFITACDDASCVTVKVSEFAPAPAVALTATLVAELVALTGVQFSGFSTESAAAETARKVVLTVR
jgi:hypothetical protein